MKKAISLFFAVVFIMSFTACNSNVSKNDEIIDTLCSGYWESPNNIYATIQHNYRYIFNTNGTVEITWRYPGKAAKTSIENWEIRDGKIAIFPDFVDDEGDVLLLTLEGGFLRGINRYNIAIWYEHTFTKGSVVSDVIPAVQRFKAFIDSKGTLDKDGWMSYKYFDGDNTIEISYDTDDIGEFLITYYDYGENLVSYLLNENETEQNILYIYDDYAVRGSVVKSTYSGSVTKLNSPTYTGTPAYYQSYMTNWAVVYFFLSLNELEHLFLDNKYDLSVNELGFPSFKALES